MGRKVGRTAIRGLAQAAIVTGVAWALIPPGEDPSLIPLVLGAVLGALALAALAVALSERRAG